MRIVVTGASGQLGTYLVDRLSGGPHELIAWSGRAQPARGQRRTEPVDLTDSLAVAAALDLADPEVVIHLAAISSTETARREPKLAQAVNVEGTRRLAEWAARHDRRLVYTSTDLVFDGSRSWNGEDDPALPILQYGQTKRDAEPAVLATPRGLVARLSLLFGPSRSETAGYFDRAIATMRAGTPQSFFIDEFRTPLDFITASRILVRLALSESTGLLHVGGRERLSRFDLMRRAAAVLGVDPRFVRADRRADALSAETRPADVSLDTSRLVRLFPDFEFPGVEDALASSIRSPISNEPARDRPPAPDPKER
jgi:dTDP-4-dehydrorhamnose reductase